MLNRLVAAALAAVVVVCLALLVMQPAHADVQPWCDYPQQDGQAALAKAVDEHLAEIHRWSPDQHPDRLTVQLDLMTQCAVVWR